eukprot:scaffold334_cov241-Pinguiococcus_pyrenoidosus.AAC.13
MWRAFTPVLGRVRQRCFSAAASPLSFSPPAYVQIAESVVKEALPSGVSEEFELTSRRELLWRPSIAHAKSLVDGGAEVVVLSGARGVGKSCALAALVAKLREDGHHVVYVPSIYEFTHRMPYCFPNPFEMQKFDVPKAGQKFLSDLLTSNEELLEGIPLAASVAGRYRKENCPPGLVDEFREYLKGKKGLEARKEATKLTSVADLARLGNDFLPIAGQVMTDVIHQLKQREPAEEGKKLIFALDEYNAFYNGVAYTFVERQVLVVDMWDMLKTDEDQSKVVEGEDDCWMGHDRREDEGYGDFTADWIAYKEEHLQMQRQKQMGSESKVGKQDDGEYNDVLTGHLGSWPVLFGKPWNKAIHSLQLRDFPQLQALHVLDPLVGGQEHARATKTQHVLAMTERIPYTPRWTGPDGAAWAARREYIEGFEGYEAPPDLWAHERPTKKMRRQSSWTPSNTRDVLDTHPFDPVSAEIVVERYSEDEVFATLAHYIDSGEVFDEKISFPELKLLEIQSQRNPLTMRRDSIRLLKQELDAETEEFLDLPY